LLISLATLISAYFLSVNHLSNGCAGQPNRWAAQQGGGPCAATAPAAVTVAVVTAGPVGGRGDVLAVCGTPFDIILLVMKRLLRCFDDAGARLLQFLSHSLNNPIFTLISILEDSESFGQSESEFRFSRTGFKQSGVVFRFSPKN
jgi:hypothetical protein